MSNEWSGDGGFYKPTEDAAWRNAQPQTGYEPQNEWNVGEPPTQDWQRPDWVETGPQHRADGGDNCGMGWASRPWKLLGNMVAWAGIVVVGFCIVAFVAGCIAGVIGVVL